MNEKELKMPGDIVPEATELAKKKKVILGPGLRRDEQKVIAFKAGHLMCKENTFWINSYQFRYVPVRADFVIGIVINKGSEMFRVDIGGSDQATLSYLAFEGATKKNRPDVNVGDLIFARVAVASRDMDPEIVCLNSAGKKGKMGILHGGFVFNCSLNLARMLLREDCPLLLSLKKEMPYEIAVGLNGRIWVKSKTHRETIALGNAILAAEYASYDDMQKLSETIGNILFT